MRFFIDTTQSMSQSVLVKNKDNSFSCLNNELDWDFQVKIEPFVVLILNINSNSKQCIGIKRVKIDYIRRQKKRYIEVSIEEAAITNTLTYEQQFDINENSNKFIFENSRISAAFNKLSSKRKEILEMLFVRNLTSDEIAKEWKCSLQYVYLLRSSALTKLRDILTRGK